MMKKKLLLCLLTISISIYSQVGINTSNPQNTFHVDGGKDNNPSGVPTIAQQLNDVILTSAGNVGIGTVDPSVKLEINNGTVNGAIKIVDGSQGNGKVLTSNANGVGTWQSPSLPVYRGKFVSGEIASNKEVSGSNYLYLNTYITLPKGQWVVNVGMTFQSNMTNNNKIWTHVVVTTDPTNLNTPILTGVNATQAPYIATNNIFGGSSSSVSWHNYSFIQGSKIYT